LSLTFLSIPASVEILGEAILDGSGIETVTIEFGSRLHQIEENTFSGCAELQCLRIPASIHVVAGKGQHFEIITFEPQLPESYSNRFPPFNPIFGHNGDV
jgi:hypothetical protein